MIIKDLLSIQQIPNETLKEIHGGCFDCDVEFEFGFVEGLNLDDILAVEYSAGEYSAGENIEGLVITPAESSVDLGFGWKGMTESDLLITLVDDSNVYPGGLQVSPID